MKAEVRNPSGALTDCSITDNADGTYSVAYTPFENGKTEMNSGFVKKHLRRMTNQFDWACALFILFF